MAQRIENNVSFRVIEAKRKVYLYSAIIAAHAASVVLLSQNSRRTAYRPQPKPAVTDFGL